MTIAAAGGHQRVSGTRSSVCRRSIAHAHRSPTVDSSQWWQLFRRLSPRRNLRLDSASNHDYDTSRPFSATAPEVPYAVYLASTTGRYHLLCFDLDVADGRDVVAEDLARLCDLLDEASWRYAVAVSGPGGGRHVWAAFPDGADVDQVDELARALAALLPSLDHGMLCNPATGCARPIGAPHRDGGRSAPDPAYHPDPATAAAALRAGNPAERVEQLLAVLPPALRQPRRTDAADPRRRVIVDEFGAPRLPGDRRALTPAAAELVTARPDSGDQSAHLWRILLGAALARWTLADVTALAADPATVGLEHLRSCAVPAGRRPRSADEAAALLARQWTRAVDRAAELDPDAARDAGDRDDDPRVREVTAAIAGIEAAAEAAPWRWSLPGGPADRCALRTACRLALAACSLTIALDVRRWAQAAGYAASTMALAARRLCRSDAVDGPPWLHLETPANGRQAAVWRLLPPIPADQEDQAPTPDAPIGPVDKTRTQGRSPRPGHPPGAPRTALAAHLARTEAHQAHDVWHPRGGLGHHIARTHAVLLTGPHSIQELAQATGYTTATIQRHVRLLEAVQLAHRARPGRVRIGRRDLDTVAQRLGTAGAGAARRERHLVDRELRDWWEAELGWRRAPRAGKPHVPRRDPHQRQLPVAAAADALTRYGRFPTTAGRADYAAAATVVRIQLGHPAAAAGAAA